MSSARRMTMFGGFVSPAQEEDSVSNMTKNAVSQRTMLIPFAKLAGNAIVIIRSRHNCKEIVPEIRSRCKPRRQFPPADGGPEGGGTGTPAPRAGCYNGPPETSGCGDRVARLH